MKESKSPTVLFLGAGASEPLGFPTTKQVMAEIGLEPQNANKQKEVTKHTELLTKIYNQLPADGKDLEGILDFLRTANEGVSYQNLDILRTEIQTQSPPEFKPIIIENTVTEYKGKLKELEKNIKEFMFRLYVFQPEKHGKKAEEIYKPLINALLIDSVFEEDVEELPIFTTNYDLVIENLADRPFMRNKFELVDGFELVGRSADRVFSLAEYEKPREKTPIKLFKLHGALNWWNRKVDNRIVQWPDISSMYNPNYDDTPVIIYPAGYGPYPRDEFHLLHDRLESYLTNAKRCIVIGYTFRDIGRASHIFDDVMRDLNKELEVIISGRKPTMEQLPKVHELFGKYGNRCTYYSEGIQALPQHLKKMAANKKPPPKADAGPKTPA